MTRWYLDTSAAIKVLVDEPESTALSRTLDRVGPDLAACWLLATELWRAVSRNPGLTHEAVTSLVDALSPYTVPPPVFNEAGLLPGRRPALPGRRAPRRCAADEC